MVTGGLLTALHWRWVFFAPVVVAAVLLVVATRMLPREGAAPGGRFDIAGAATLTAGHADAGADDRTGARHRAQPDREPC